MPYNLKSYNVPQAIMQQGRGPSIYDLIQILQKSQAGKGTTPGAGMGMGLGGPGAGAAGAMGGAAPAAMSVAPAAGMAGASEADAALSGGVDWSGLMSLFDGI